MKSFTIHKLDAEAATRLEQRARQERTSINKTAKKLLREALGVGDPTLRDHRDDFVEFLGTWTEEDAAEFAEAVRVFDEIDMESWT